MQFKNKKFLESIDIAKKIRNKETTYEQERNKLYLKGQDSPFLEDGLFHCLLKGPRC